MPSKSKSKTAGKGLQTTRTHSPPGAKGGQLRIGNPGNKGGPGRPPNKIRESIRTALLDERVLKEVRRRLGPTKIKKMPDETLVKYLKELGLLGLGTKIEHGGVDDGPISHGVLLIPGKPVSDDDEETPS